MPKKKIMKTEREVLCLVRVADDKHCGGCNCGHVGYCYRGFDAETIPLAGHALKRDKKTGLMLRRNSCIAAEKAVKALKGGK